MTDSAEPEQYSDFYYWRLPPSTVATIPAREEHVENPCGGVSVMDTDDDVDASGFNSFSFWHTPPQTPQQLGIDVSQECALGPRTPTEQTEAASSPEPYAIHASSSRRQEWLEVEVDDNDDNDMGAEDEDADETNEADPMDLLSGGAGARLLGLLGQLSQHLGTSSRFARAAGLLQEDMMRQREAAVRAAQTSERVEPLEGSTLEQPEVRNSVGSLLHILQNSAATEAAVDPLRLNGAAPAPPDALMVDSPLVLFETTNEPLPPSPASPESIATLSPPCPSFGLDEAPANCPICLEGLEDLSSSLQMPCARQHVFHRECLLKWLDERNTCPVCRHNMPLAVPVDSGDASGGGAAAGTEEARPQIEQTEPPAE